jgi:hypothetical protein
MADSNTTPHTPPPKSQSLPPDTVPFGRYTSQGDYRSGDLKLGRNAVLSELGRRYLEVPFDLLSKCVGTPSQQDLKRTHDNLSTARVATNGKAFPHRPPILRLMKTRCFGPSITLYLTY